MAMEEATLVKRTNKLFVLRAKGNGEEYPLHGEMLVGREMDCSIALNSGHISRYHAKINVSANGVYIEDLHSTNGTFVNGSKIKGRVKLSVGDEVGFDDLYFRLASNGAPGEDETALSPQNAEQKDDRTRPLVKPSPPTPIRPSLTTAEPAKHVEGTAKADSPAGRARQASFANDIDLDRPLLSRHTLADEAEFEKHLEQRFHELDALMDDIPIEQVRSAGIDECEAQAIAPEMTESAQIEVEQPVPVEAERKAEVAEVDAEQALSTEESMNEGEGHTQILSTMQLDQFIERHRYDQDLNIGSGPRLIVTTAPLRGKLFSLQEFATGGSIQIGREPQAEIYLNDQTISTDHARLTKSDSGYTLSATNARNGILVNGVSHNRVVLNHNDKIQIGRTELVFKTDLGDSEPLRTPQADDPLVNNGNGRRYSMLITIIAMAVLVAAIVATSR